MVAGLNRRIFPKLPDTIMKLKVRRAWGECEQIQYNKFTLLQKPVVKFLQHFCFTLNIHQHANWKESTCDHPHGQVDFYHREGYLIPKALVVGRKSGELQLNMKIPWIFVWRVCYTHRVHGHGILRWCIYLHVACVMWPIFLVNVLNVGKYTIHGAYGIHISTS